MQYGNFAKLTEIEQPKQISLPEQLPILPLRDFIIYPHMVSPLIIARDKSLKLITEVMDGDRFLGLLAQRNPENEQPDKKSLFRVGTAAYVLKKLKFPDNSIRILVQGLSRFKVTKFVSQEPYFIAFTKQLDEELIRDMEVEALQRNVIYQFQKIMTRVPNLPDELQIAVMNMDDPGRLADLLMTNLNVTLFEKQEMLECVNIKLRLKKLTFFINRELQVLDMGTKIQTQVQTEIGKNHREFYLREQLKVIQRELGETDERTSDINELRSKIKQAQMPEAVEKEALRELERLSKMVAGAAEYTVARTYLEWMVTIPWNKSTIDNLDLDEAEKILNCDHYNLTNVKERILEFLAVRKLKQNMKGPILCFVGPPGVGKTSLGRSIARALNRKFVRISLGGLKDEAEIRGHRRTYVGALPGRIIQSIKNSGYNNPVFMLDEVDKIGQDFRGDPSSALLEVLDPEQNFSFFDNYLDVPFDLSRVLFITTANYLDPIPAALQDRLEVIELPGYTEQEKTDIAFQYLIPKQLAEHGLNKKMLIFQPSAIKKMITEYTREAGLRNLEREIAKVCRRVAKKVARGQTEKLIINQKNLSEFLGAEKFYSEIADRVTEPGIATALAWTPYGGDILFIECSLVRGQKGLLLTGQMGDVMKESAQAALTYVRANADKLNFKIKQTEDAQIHIHVPAGAIPKDGPSAGVAMVVALISLLKKQRVKKRMAMTGEITLRGKILPVGGVKEKILAARRSGITEIILPGKNEKDLAELSATIMKNVKIHLVENIEDVLALVLD